MIIVSIDGSRAFRDASTQKKRTGQITELCDEAEKSGGRLIPGTENIGVIFGGKEGSGNLCAVLFLEAAARVFSLHEGESTGLRITVDCPDADEAHQPHDFSFPGISLTRRAAAVLSRFIVTEPLPGNKTCRIARFAHRECRCPLSSLAARPRSSDIQTAIVALNSLANPESGIKKVLITGPFGSAQALLREALSGVCGPSLPAFPVLGPGPKKRNIYTPLIDAIDFIIRAEPSIGIHRYDRGSQSSHQATLEALASWVNFFRRYPYKTSFGPDAAKTLELNLGRALVIYAENMKVSGLPAFIIVHEPSEFHPDCLTMLENTVAGLADSGLRLAMAGPIPAGANSGPAILLVRTMGMSFFDTIQAARHGSAIACPSLDPSLVAKAANQDPFRLALILHCAQDAAGFTQDTPTEELVTRALKKIPDEYLVHLVIAGLAEGVLNQPERAAFLASEGFSPDGSRCIDAFFESMGFIATDSGEPRLAHRETPLVARDLLEDRGSAVMASFIALLERKMREGRISPCLSIYRTLAPSGDRASPEAQSLALDCMMEESAVNSFESGAWTEADTPFAAYPPFLAAYARGQRVEAREQAEALKNAAKGSGAPNSLAATLAALTEASVEYAERRPASAAALAKTAVLGIRSRRAPRIEARAQRILGLCALAGGQLIQGCAYLSNAGDIAAPAPDPAECARARISEAGVCLVLGDFDRAGILGRETIAVARQSFRPDFEEIGIFILARIDCELGRYAEATAGFRSLAALAGQYAHTDCEQRARVWEARSSFAGGDSTAARAFLETLQTDAEAQWFLAECLSGLNLPEEAFIAADRAAALRGFKPGDIDSDKEVDRYLSADKFSWDDGFSSLEGPSMGISSSRSLAAEQTLAFRLYAQSLCQPETAERNIECLLSLVREKRLAVIHPYAYLYFYYAYRMAIVGECSGMSPLNLLGRAFKALQLRAGKLFVESDFKDFFESNNENAAIMRAARHNKLM